MALVDELLRKYNVRAVSMVFCENLMSFIDKEPVIHSLEAGSILVL